MNVTIGLVAAMVVLTCAGLAAWAWLAMALIDDLRAFARFDGMHFED
jgi:hypothetical protein